ncbi:iron chaperone [Conyzicola sp.]|uniref:iron chaperone n=1 Tax=Conyzicola sp. TaxID=1969404 RepID=UPI003989361B
MERGYPAGTVDEYLAALPEIQRSALESVRRMIRAAAPGVTERLGYQIPMFEYHRNYLLGLSVADGDCCLHLMSPPLARQLAGPLAEGELLGCTVHFAAERPLSEETVRRIVGLRTAEIDASVFARSR